MNNNFVNQNSFPGTPLYTSNGVSVPNQQTQMNYNVPLEQSYIENILRLNRGKKVEIYASYPDSDEWRNKVFSGILHAPFLAFPLSSHIIKKPNKLITIK